MNGAADLGGMMGFGPVAPETDEPPFHHDWERRVFAVTLAMGATGAWNLDQSRFARESLPPPQYLTSTYYQIWLAGLEKLLAERGLTVDEADQAEVKLAVKRVLRADQVSDVLARGGPVDRAEVSPARFKVGDSVIARNTHPSGHTRLPRYLRGHRGTIHQVHGVHVYPDSNASGNGEDPQWLYGVEFSASELWGTDTNPGDTVMADCWEPYLEPA